GQRCATNDVGADASGAVARALFWSPAAAARPPSCGSTLTSVLCPTRIWGEVSSARASAIDWGTSRLCCDETGLVTAGGGAACNGGAGSCGRARAVLALSSRLYQHARFVARSTRKYRGWPACVVPFGADRQLSAGLTVSCATAAKLVPARRLAKVAAMNF